MRKNNNNRMGYDYAKSLLKHNANKKALELKIQEEVNKMKSFNERLKTLEI